MIREALQLSEEPNSKKSCGCKVGFDKRFAKEVEKPWKTPTKDEGGNECIARRNIFSMSWWG